MRLDIRNMGLLVNIKNEKLIKGASEYINDELLNMLYNQDYEIYFKKDNDKIYFLAFLRKSDTSDAPFFFEVEANLSGEFSDFYRFNEVAMTFIKYLYEYEEEVTEMGRRDELYAPLGDEFVDDLTLDETTRRKKNILRTKFSEFLLLNKFDKEEVGTLDRQRVEYSFSAPHDFLKNKDEACFYLSLVIHTPSGKKRSIRKNDDFFASLDTETVFEQAGLEISTKENAFDPLDYKILTILSKNRKRNTWGYDSEYQFATFAKFLDLYIGNTFLFDGREMRVNPHIIQEDFRLDENGEFLFPELDDYLINDKRFYVFKNNSIIIHEFKDARSALLVDYLMNINKSDIKYIKDLVLKEAVKSPSFRINKTEGYSINLYVDLDDTDALIFKTKFVYNEEEISKENYVKVDNNSLIYAHFKEELEKICGVENGRVVNEGYVLIFLYASYKDLSNYASLYLSSKIKALNKTSLPTITVSVKNEDDLLGLDLSIGDLTEDEVNDILAAYRHKRKFFLVRDQLIRFSDEDTKALDSIMELSEDYDIDFNDLRNGKLPKYAYFSLKEIANKEIQLKQDEFIDKFVEKLADYSHTELSLTPEIKEKIRPYQENGIKWLKTLYELNLGAILADDMGLGKTLQTVGLINEIKEEKPILIICPKSVTYNWANEVKLWSKGLKVEVLTDNKVNREKKIKSIKNDKKMIYVTSYDSLRNDLELYEGIEFSLLVSDEAQFIKNAYAKKAKAIKTINAYFKLALTGTPIENSLADLWSIFDLIMRGYLSTFDKFKAKYIDDENSREDLRKKVSPFILRRVKNDVLKDLPKKEVLIQTISMNEEEKDLYDASIKSARKQLTMAENSFSMFPVLMHLREICVDPMVFYDNYKTQSSKFDFILDNVPDAIEVGHKFLIFSSFATVLHHLQKVLEENGIASHLIDGQVSAEDRITMANDFNESETVNVMLVSLKAGGTGLNLHGADIVIHLDPWWNFAAEEQATDRAHRIGQKRPVTVYKLIMHDTIEERVMRLQELKKELNQSIIKVDGETTVKITKEDIKYLLS